MDKNKKDWLIEPVDPEIYRDDREQELVDGKWGDPTYEETREDFIARMDYEGFDILYPDPDELFIDIDTEEQYQTFLRHFHRLREEKGTFDDIQFIERFSKSGPPRRHIHVRMPNKLSSVERIAWQAVLGSDLVRELLSMIRWSKVDQWPTLFCEPKEKE